MVLDKDGIVQSEMKNNLPLGRNVDEVLRIVDVRNWHKLEQFRTTSWRSHMTPTTHQLYRRAGALMDINVFHVN